MSKQMNAGILGLGIHLPKQVRTNDWWPAATVEKWQERQAHRVMQAKETDFNVEGLGPGARRVLEELAKLRDDPFRGSVERRILPDEFVASDMSVEAAKAAMEDAKVDPKEIDVLLDYCILPDKLTVPNVFVVHKKAGLSDCCMSVAVDTVCNSFSTQLALAGDFVRSGRAKRVLCVQTYCATRVCPSDEPFSPWHGDGASAMVVGPVSENFGILGQSHRTDRSLYDALGASVPGARWDDEGRIIAFPQDPAAARRLVLGMADRGLEVVSEALQSAGVKATDITFYGAHPSTVWLPETTREYMGLVNAKTVNTFPWAGNVGAANIPLVLSVGRKEGLLKSGDLVATYSGGVGSAWSGMVMRWGDV